MVFSSLVFLSFFLPAVLLLYPLFKHPVQNVFLLVVSLFFYWWGEPAHLWIMMATIFIAHAGGRLMHWLDASEKRSEWRLLACMLAIGLNLSLLLYFKYYTFFSQAWLDVSQYFGASSSRKIEAVLLPIGISFYVFQGISFLMDVYRRPRDGRKPGILDTALYISMFPQLIAGPIVRYDSIAENLKRRSESLEDYFEGLVRFCFGLGKKVLLANPCGEIADYVFSRDVSELTLTSAWLGLFCYALQIYFDFSGYSDMAIGLGRYFGFAFPENFNLPYAAGSMTEFWRRWHMSLSSWFKDYLYIPLGGNRKSRMRTLCNLTAVFLLTGLWHGANWTFVIWGIWHGLFLILEKFLFRSGSGGGVAKLFGHFYTLLVVTLGWLVFRSESLTNALDYFMAMFRIAGVSHDLGFLMWINVKTGLVLAVGALLALKKVPVNSCPAALRGALAAIVLALSYLCIVNSGYNPFIYFQF